jgi:hypothetical protein
VSSDAANDGLDATMREFVSGQQLFNRYRLVKTLGRGGMGVVWLAHDKELERDVALKFLPEIIIHDRGVLNDLKRETRRSLELTHKNIVRIYDFVHDDTSGCISMEYVDGDTLANLRADKPHKIFEPAELTEWVSQLCDALDYAHNNARIVHRDLKPGNLMVNQRCELKVSDFGIARSLSDSVSRITVAAGRSGTLVYMSPQQLNGERGNHLDDMYSLGASLYELLTSRPPFYSGNVDRQIREKIPPSIAQRRNELEIIGRPVNRVWEDLVRDCLAKDPSKRPQSIAEVAQRLEIASPKTRRAKDRTAKSHWRLPFLGIAALVAALALWGGYLGVRRMIQAKGPPAVREQIAQAYPAGMGGVKVNTSPPGAAATLGGLGTKLTPATFDANKGKYSLFIELDGYEPIARSVQAQEGRLIDLGMISLQRGKTKIELSSEPPGATIFQGQNTIGTTPFHRDDFPSGQTKFILVADGYLPREVPAQLKPKAAFKVTFPLAKPLPLYKGVINGSRPVTIALGADLKSGTMTQSSTRGDTIVKFDGLWDLDEGTLRAKTHEVVSQPEGILWGDESFTLRFSDDGKTAVYECNYGTELFEAKLRAPKPNEFEEARPGG